MILEVGKGGKVRFIRGIKKTNIFECGPNGLVLERDKNQIILYVTNNRCSEIYAKAVLGGNEIQKKRPLVVAAYSENIMVMDGGELMVAVDFDEKKVAINKPEIEVIGKKDWADAPRTPWTAAHDALFNLAAPTQEMDKEAAAAFWKWFLYNEVEILDKVAAGGAEAQSITGRVKDKLCPVFPYENARDLEFRLGCTEDGYEFVMYHFNQEKLMADAVTLGEMMLEPLKENWVYLTEA